MAVRARAAASHRRDGAGGTRHELRRQRDAPAWATGRAINAIEQRPRRLARGTVYGTLLGALIVGVFRNGLSLAGYDVLYQTLVVGVLVILAMAVDQWIRKVRV